MRACKTASVDGSGCTRLFVFIAFPWDLIAITRQQYTVRGRIHLDYHWTIKSSSDYQRGWLDMTRLHSAWLRRTRTCSAATAALVSVRLSRVCAPNDVAKVGSMLSL